MKVWRRPSQLQSMADGCGGGAEAAAAAAEEAERLRLEALREAEERRKEKHRKKEAEREKMRQSIRDKYGIKKKEEEPKEAPPVVRLGSSLNRRKKIAPEPVVPEAEDQDDFTRLKKNLDTQLKDLKQSVAESKCVLQ